MFLTYWTLLPRAFILIFGEDRKIPLSTFLHPYTFPVFSTSFLKYPATVHLQMRCSELLTWSRHHANKCCRIEISAHPTRADDGGLRTLGSLLWSPLLRRCARLGRGVAHSELQFSLLENTGVRVFASLGYCEDFRRRRQSSLAWRRRVCRDHAAYINCVAVPSLLKPALNFQAFLGYSGLFSPRMDCRFPLPVTSPPPLTSRPRVNLTRIWQTSPLNWEGLMCVNVLPKDIMCVCFFSSIFLLLQISWLHFSSKGVFFFLLMLNLSEQGLGEAVSCSLLLLFPSVWEWNVFKFCFIFSLLLARKS